LFSLEKSRLRGHLIAAYTFLKLGSGEGGADLSLVTSRRTQGQGEKLHQGKFRLDTGKRLFMERVVDPWNRLARGSGHGAKPVKSSRSIWTMLLVIRFSFR